MDYQDTLRTYNVAVPLCRDEYERIEATRKKFGVSRAEAFRRECSEFFNEVGVKQGRRTGISPQRRTG